MHKRFAAAILFVILASGPVFADGNRPTVGAIRWDAWFPGSEYERYLGPKQWHYRAPFFAKFISDTSVTLIENRQAIIDKEIDYAASAGIDYWAICYYHPTSKAGDRYNYGWKLFLSSKRNHKMRFCLILPPGRFAPEDQWEETCESLARIFAHPRYMKVCGGRPLIYLRQAGNPRKDEQSWARSKAASEVMRRKIKEAGLAEPYFVPQVGLSNMGRGVEFIDKLGYDALSGYTSTGRHPGSLHLPYGALARSNGEFWNACKATGKKVIPLLNTGWDGRPRSVNPEFWYYAGWFSWATPREIAANLRNAIDWVRANPNAAEANTILIYAWNEIDEGGWLLPTLSEGAARLDSIREVLKKR
jgi:hypothetical protein